MNREACCSVSGKIAFKQTNCPCRVHLRHDSEQNRWQVLFSKQTCGDRFLNVSFSNRVPEIRKSVRLFFSALLLFVWTVCESRFVRFILSETFCVNGSWKGSFCDDIDRCYPISVLTSRFGSSEQSVPQSVTDWVKSWCTQNSTAPQSGRFPNPFAWILSSQTEADHDQKTLYFSAEMVYTVPWGL